MNMILGRILVSLVLALAAVASGRNIVSDRGEKFGISIILYLSTMSLQAYNIAGNPNPAAYRNAYLPQIQTAFNYNSRILAGDHIPSGFRKAKSNFPKDQTAFNYNSRSIAGKDIPAAYRQAESLGATK